MDRARIEELYPAYPDARHAPIVAGNGFVLDGQVRPAAPPTAAARRAVAGAGRWLRKLDSLAGLDRARHGPAGRDRLGTPGSSAGKRTASGKPLLATPAPEPDDAGDLVPDGLTALAVLRLRASLLRRARVVIGIMDGSPGGFTNLDPDVTDLYWRSSTATV